MSALLCGSLVRCVGLPKPSISLSHDEEVTLGSNVTIDCRSNGTAVRFYFQKYGVAKPVQLIQKNGTVAKFSISNASWEHSGYYSCTYSALPDCFAISEPSDEVELQLTGKKNLVLHASPVYPGTKVTIHCQSQDIAAAFYFKKDTDQMVPTAISNNGAMAIFDISNIKPAHAGNYICTYRPKLELFVTSPSSDPVELLFRDTPQSHGDSQHLNSFFLLCIDDSLIKPSISINPSELVALGGEVNIVCTIAYGSAQFYLHKTGDPTPKYSRMGNLSTHTFPITNISLEDKGHYTCSYICSGNSFFISKHSAPLELLVTGKAGPPAISNICFRMAFEWDSSPSNLSLSTDPSLPRPSLSLSSVIVNVGETVSLQCHSQDRAVTFYLQKSGETEPLQRLVTSRNTATFTIIAEQEHNRSFACSYRPSSDLFVISEPSKPAEFLVIGKGVVIASTFPTPLASAFISGLSLSIKLGVD
uniref:Ig-like domain-containing protein n=1 Tax=Podarcis muralis TaxID=64176 RepID=A0A670K676_PODMU